MLMKMDGEMTGNNLNYGYITAELSFDMIYFKHCK